MTRNGVTYALNKPYQGRISRAQIVKGWMMDKNDEDIPGKSSMTDERCL